MLVFEKKATQAAISWQLTAQDLRRHPQHRAAALFSEAFFQLENVITFHKSSFRLTVIAAVCRTVSGLACKILSRDMPKSVTLYVTSPSASSCAPNASL